MICNGVQSARLRAIPCLARLSRVSSSAHRSTRCFIFLVAGPRFPAFIVLFRDQSFLCVCARSWSPLPLSSAFSVRVPGGFLLIYGGRVYNFGRLFCGPLVLYVCWRERAISSGYSCRSRSRPSHRHGRRGRNSVSFISN